MELKIYVMNSYAHCILLGPPLLHTQENIAMWNHLLLFIKDSIFLSKITSVF